MKNEVFLETENTVAYRKPQVWKENFEKRIF